MNAYTCVQWREVGKCFFLQAEDVIRDLVRSRGLGDVYKRQVERRHRVAVAHGGEGRRDFGRRRAGLVGDAHEELSLIHI